MSMVVPLKMVLHLNQQMPESINDISTTIKQRISTRLTNNHSRHFTHSTTQLHIISPFHPSDRGEGHVRTMGSNTRHRWPRYSKCRRSLMTCRLSSGSVAPSFRRMTFSVCPALYLQ